MKTHGFDSWHSWKMAAAAAIVMFTNAGFSWGMRPYLFVALMNKKGGTREQNSWPFVIPFAMFVLAAPVIIPLAKRLTLRPLVMTGVIIASVSCSLCFFSTNFYYLIVFYGCLQGCGHVLGYSPLTFLYAIYFKKYRTTAAGFVLLSLHLGSLVSSNVGVYILEEYGFQSTLLIMGAISLNGLLGAVVLVQHNGQGIRPSSPNREKQNRVKNQVSLDVVTSQTGLRIHEPSTNLMFKEHVLNDNGELCLKGENEIKMEMKSDHFARDQESVLASEVMVSPVHGTCIDTGEFDAANENEIKNGTPENKDIKLFGNVLAESKKDKVEWNKECGDNIACQTQDPTQPEFKINETKAFWRNNTGLMSVLTNPYFLITASSEQIVLAFQIALGVTIGDYANDKDIPLEKSLYIFPAFTVGTVLARLALGWIADKNYVSKPSYMAIVSAMLALPVFTLTFVSGFGILIFCVALCGVFVGNLATLSAILYAEFLPQQVVYIGVSISSSLIGVTGILTPFIIGAFRDNVGSYDNMLRMNAGLLILCSCFWTNASIRWRRRNVSTTPVA